jgi:hypothetical protein
VFICGSNCRFQVETTVADFIGCGKKKKVRNHQCAPAPGCISSNVNTKDPNLSVLFMSKGILRLSSVSQMKTSPLFMKTPSYLG